MPRSKGRDYGRILIFAALLVTVTRYAGAFVASDLGVITGVMSEVLTGFMVLTGIGMGILDVLGTAFLFDGWRRVMPRAGQRWPTRFKVLTFFIILLLLTGLAILVPFTISRIRQETMAEVLGPYDWLWALAVNVAPYLLIGGIATAQAQVFHIEAAKGDVTLAATGDTPSVTGMAHAVKGDERGSIPTHVRREALYGQIANGGFTVTGAAYEFGVSRKTIYSDLDHLEDAGKIERNGTGVKVRRETQGNGGE